MCSVDCPHLLCRSFSSKNERWSGYCSLMKKIVADVSVHPCNVAIQQDLFTFL